MLVLSRKVGQSILIGDDIKVTICTGRRGQIRVGIEAPADVKVLRAEVKRRDEQKKVPA